MKFFVHKKLYIVHCCDDKAFYENHVVDFGVLTKFSDFQNLMKRLRIYEYCKSIIISDAILPHK